MATRITTINDAYRQDQALTQLIDRLPEAFASGEGELIYDGRNKLRRFVMSSGLVVIVKAYKRPNLFQKICYSTFWENKASKAYRYAVRLKEMGINTPEAIATMTVKEGGMVDSYYFVSTEDTRPDCRILRDGHLDNPQPLVDALAAYLIRLHEAGFLHGDTNLSNFLYEQNDDGGYHFAVIDTNRSVFLNRPATHAEVMKNLTRVTHVRPLLADIATSYARQRGWDKNKTEQGILSLIDSFERKRRIRRYIFHPFK